MRRADLFLGVVVAVVGALALEMALHLAMFAQSGAPGPGFFPRLITILLTGLGVILAVTSLRRPRQAGGAGALGDRPAGQEAGPGQQNQEAVIGPLDPGPLAAGPETAGDGRRRFLRAGSLWLLFSLAVPLVVVLGFVPAAVAFIYVLLFTLEKRRNWRAVAVAIAAPVAVSFIFTVLLKVQLPQGALSHLPLGI
jgi:Tripartite tricarboxylate transporter TctB family